MVAILVTPASTTESGEPAKPPPAARRIVAARTTVAPVIDGKLDDACWKEAAQATDFSVFYRPEVLHPEQTIGRVCYDGDSLYIAMECRVKEMSKFKARLAEAAGKFDYRRGGVIEVFLDTSHDRKTFQQYLLHSNGSSMMTLSKGDIFKILNEDYLSSRATLTDTGFTIEMSFPLAMLHLHPDTAKVWGFNLNRAHDLYDERYDKNGFFSSWNSTRGKGFPTPEAFGELVMDGDFSRFYWQVAFVREPQAGDSAVQVRIKNETGRDFSGLLALSIVQPNDQAARYAQPFSLAAGAEQTVAFEHSVAANDAVAKYEVSLTDARGRVCYLGGTQKEDLTPGDAWPPPAPTAKQQQAGYLVFQRPYIQSVLYKAVPRQGETVSALSMTACPGEFEPVTFSLYPVRDVPSLRVTVSDLDGPGRAAIPASAIDVRRVVWQSIWKNPRSFEAREHLLRRLDRMRLAKGRSQRFWLTVSVPAAAPAGDYRGTVSLTSDGLVTRVPLHVRVLPFELSPPDGMGYFMYYPGVKRKEFSNAEFFAKTLKDMRDHGMTTFSIYNWIKVEDPQTGKAQLDVDDRVAENYGVTYSRMIDMLREAGLGAKVPLFDVYSMHYPPKLIVELDQIFKERSWPEILFYICDEIEYPGRIARARRILEGIKKLSPGIKTTTALGPKGAAALGHMYDVWIGCSRPEMIEKCLSMGKRPWTYSCRAVYEVCSAYERYFFGQYAWKLGLKGVGLWSYAEDDSFYDRFGREHGYGDEFVFTPEWKHRYGHVYFEQGEVIPTVTWEGVREGIDDFRYMLTLRKAAQQALVSEDPATRAAGEAGVKLLGEIRDRTGLTPALNDRSGSKYLRDSQYVGDLDAERERAIGAVIKITDRLRQ